MFSEQESPQSVKHLCRFHRLQLYHGLLEDSLRQSWEGRKQQFSVGKQDGKEKGAQGLEKTDPLGTTRLLTVGVKSPGRPTEIRRRSEISGEKTDGTKQNLQGT